MIRLKYIRVFLMLLLVFYSCDRNKKEAIDSIVKKWMGKEILFPENSLFITYDNRDSVDFLSMKSDYRIVTYVNSETTPFSACRWPWPALPPTTSACRFIAISAEQTPRRCPFR